MPSLIVVSRGESFATLWPALAAECDVTLAIVTESTAVVPSADAVLLVVGAGDEPGIEPHVRELAGHGMDVAAIGAVPDHRLAAALVRSGAADYFALPNDTSDLRSWLRDRCDRLRAVAAGASFAATEGRTYQFEGIIGTSAALETALARVARIIPHAGVTILLTGETGTGKELVARAIHYQGPRATAPFVDVNCAAIPEQLLESELFGHEKGAFTGATAAKPGLFELATRGTIFLDEIGHLALPLQGKLLRTLEERVMRRVGGTRVIPFDVRVIAATHVDLRAAVRRGEFREDLFFRLNVVPVSLPPLRERREDIIPLAKHFLARYAVEYRLPEPTLTAAAQAALIAQPWPGNVRELRNVLERSLLLADGPTLDAADVCADQDTESAGAPANATSLDAIIHAAATSALARSGGNKSEAARTLGISRTRLQRLLDPSPAPESLTSSMEESDASSE